LKTFYKSFFKFLVSQFVDQSVAYNRCAARYILNAPPRSPSLPPLVFTSYIGYRSRVGYATNYAA